MLLKQAGYAPGEYELSWPYIEDDPLWKGFTDLIVQSLEAAGFKASPFPTTGGNYTTVNNDPDAPVNFRLFNAWCSDWPTGNSFFPDLFQSQGKRNLGFFAEPVVDAEIERISLLPIDEQHAAWAALDKTIMTDYYPAIISGYIGVAMLHGSNIGGLNNDSVFGAPTWKDIYLVQ